MNEINSRGEILRRMGVAGLSPDTSERYFETLQLFVSARMTKVEYLVKMRSLLVGPDKVAAHNKLIRDILKQAMARKMDMPDVPVLVAMKDRKVAPRKPAAPRTKSNAAAIAAASVTSVASVASVTPPVTPATMVTVKAAVASTVTTTMVVPPSSVRVVQAQETASAPVTIPPVAVANPSLPDKPEIRGEKRGKKEAKQEASMVVSAATVDDSTRKRQKPKVVPVEVPTPVHVPTAYDRISFIPTRPGQALDLELFLKLRHRTKQVVYDIAGLSGVRDDAIALLAHALEIYLKNIIESTVSCMAKPDRDTFRPGTDKALQIGTNDLFLARKLDTRYCCDEIMIDLERLTEAIF
mmetsp:Transcript_15405/g.31213  ORF Transcript_15405/g.31213 Transcript_15405/m.31213 type:complete len:353 (-) Transcript_15405:1234-2292(-)